MIWGKAVDLIYTNKLQMITQMLSFVNYVDVFTQLFQIAAVQRVQHHTGLTHHFKLLTFGRPGASLLSTRKVKGLTCDESAP